jgi:membrane-bound lytic murein transglycosylase D
MKTEHVPREIGQIPDQGVASWTRRIPHAGNIYGAPRPRGHGACKLFLINQLPQKGSTMAGEDKNSGAKEQPRPKKSRMQRLNTRRGRRNLAIGMAGATIGGIAATTGSDQQAPQQPGPLAMGDEEAAVAFTTPKSWDIKETKNEQVDFFIDFLRLDNHDKTKLWLERLGKYGPMIQQKLKERGMPQDLIWLATIESGLDPNAYSKADAAGLWQFIEETGERHGLEVSKYVDERRDPLAATDAALDYLKKLNDRFGGSWYLAAAGYNTGENRVERIVREKAGGRFGDEEVFWEIASSLPSETRDYVPVMLAMGHIGKDPAKYGFTDLQPQEPLVFEELKVAGGTRLEDVAKQINVDPDVLYELNPHLVKKQTPPGREWAVRIPVQDGEQLA